MTTSIQTLHGSEVEAHLSEIARLRIEVFREFPYLYDGTFEYERRYLKAYSDSENSIFVLALDGSRVVGVSTGLPLEDADEEFQQPIRSSEFDLSTIFYFGESVLLRDYRGFGLGHRFFDEREAFARKLGRTITAFSTVERPADHPRKPARYHPLDPFWIKRGYTKRSDLVAHYAWKDIGDEEETKKPMVFWVHDL